MAKDCEKCKKQNGLDCELQNELAKKAQPVEYIVHEGILWRMERTQKRLVAIILVLIALLAASWIGFFVYESQYEDIHVEQDVDTGEGDAFVAGAGDVYYGTNQTENQNTQTQDGR
ncbi:MAG: hypothetical protein IJP68_01540 [Selenomonadaceae bacterium]|nr:hypothetical protein [Selenomonadaceae bacterium]